MKNRNEGTESTSVKVREEWVEEGVEREHMVLLKCTRRGDPAAAKGVSAVWGGSGEVGDGERSGPVLFVCFPSLWEWLSIRA